MIEENYNICIILLDKTKPWFNDSGLWLHSFNFNSNPCIVTHNGNTYTPNAGIRQDLQYTYDLEGTITTTNDAAPANTYAQGPGNLLRRFSHDPLRRLISATGREISNVYQQPSWDLNIRPMDYTDTNTYTRSYQYDKLGNIQYLSHKATGHANQNFDRDFTYDGTDNKLRAFTVNSNLFQNKYDPSGNLAQEGQSRFYEWTANDKMAVFKTQAGGSTPSVYTNYFYNAQGERIKKHTRKGNKVIVTFYMDGGMFETSYVKTVGGGIDSKRFYNTLKIEDEGALIATLRVGKNVDDHTPAIKYIVGDHLNNSTAVLKTSGSLINREEFYPFGETSFGGFQYKRYRYNGKEKDEESGLYEYGQRYYAPWVCRFVSVDPIAESYPQLSSYNYAGNKPITSPDIEGLQGTEDKKHDDRKRKDGRNIKDGIRGNKDVDYEMHNLPSDPKDGQKQNYYYTKGDTRQAQWTYSKENDAWGMSTGNFAELRDENIKPATSFWLPGKHTQSAVTDEPTTDGNNSSSSVVNQGNDQSSGSKIGKTVEKANEIVTPITLITNVAEDTFTTAGNVPLRSVSGGKSVLYINKMTLGSSLFKDKRLMRIGRMNKNWAKSIGGVLKGINRVAVPLSILSTTSSIIEDGKLSAGDAVKAGLLGVGLAVPVVGLGLGAADLIGQHFFDTSMTDAISNFADSSFTGTIDITDEIKSVKKMFGW